MDSFGASSEAILSAVSVSEGEDSVREPIMIFPFVWGEYEESAESSVEVGAVAAMAVERGADSSPRLGP